MSGVGTINYCESADSVTNISAGLKSLGVKNLVTQIKEMNCGVCNVFVCVTDDDDDTCYHCDEHKDVNCEVCEE